MIMFLFNILVLIEFSSSEQCPSLKYCTCSTDLTIVKCTDQQLTNEFLFNLNNQLTNSTKILNLSSNSLTSIKPLSNLNSLQILDLSLNKIRHLPSNLFLKYPRLISLYIQKNPLRNLPKNLRNLSNINLNLSNNSSRNYLQQSQIVHENEQIILNCSSNTQHYWTLNGQFYPSTILSSTYSTILIHHLQVNHSGIWTCQNSDSIHHSVSLTVLSNSSNYFCQSIQMNTSKGYFYWPRTIINQRIETKCPHGSAAWLGDSNTYARAWYTCSSNGQWMNFDISQCAYQTNISRMFDYLSLDENNLLLHLVKYLAEINRNQMELNDIILLIDLIDEQQEKFQNQDRIMLIYHLTDFILQMKFDFALDNQYQLAMNRLRLIIQRLLDLTNQSWLYIGKELTAMTLQSPSSSILCFVSNRSLLTINCDMNHQRSKSQLVTIAFPAYLNTTNQYSLFRIIVYRQSILFPSNENNPVVYIRPVSRNSLSTIRLTFSDPSDEVSIGVWDTNQTVWQRKSSICRINYQNDDFLSTDCILSNNNSLSITYFNNQNHLTSIFLNQKYSQLIICISSTIAAMCFIISILFYIYFHQISPLPRRLFHCLINYWISLSILFPLFAFGIERNEYPFLCHFIGISLHYLCLTTIIWLTLITYSIWRKLYVISIDKDDQRKSSLSIADDDGKIKPVIQFYLLSYGVALFICGINVFVSREQHPASRICFLNNFNSMLILIISMLILIFLLLVFLLFARNYIKTLYKQSGIINSKEIFLLSNRNSRQSYLTNINDQYKSINQLLSILSQLILLIFLFLSILSIYLRPLKLFKLRFEHIIYSHLYAFFVLFLAFYVLAFHVLSKIGYYLQRTKDIGGDEDDLSNQSLSIDNKELNSPSSSEDISILPQTCSHESSNKQVADISQNTAMTDDHGGSSKRLINTTSKYYIYHEHILKTNSAQNIRNDPLPISSSETIFQESMGSPKDASDQRLPKRSIEIPIEYRTMPAKTVPLRSSQLVSSQSFTHSLSPSQAVIRTLPIVRLSLQIPPQNLSKSVDTVQSNDQAACGMMLSSSTEEYNIINQNDPLPEPKPNDNHARVLYIDEDDERSVSLISSVSNSQTSSYTITMRNRSQTLSNSSSSSSSSNFSIDFYSPPTKIHESSV